MKDKRTQKLMIVAVISLIIAFIEGFIYFEEYSEHLLIRIIMALENSINAFVFSPSIDIKDVAEELSENQSFIRIFFIYAYSVAVITAQICTATALVTAIRYILTKNIHNIVVHFKTQDSVVIFGYNDDIISLINNTYNNKERKTVIYLITSDDLTEKQKLEIMSRNVVVFCLDICKEKENSVQVKKIHKIIRKSKKIILMCMSETRNLAIYMELHERFKDDKELLNSTVCYVVNENSITKNIMEDYINNIRVDETAENKGRMDISFISLSEIYARNFFDTHLLWDNFMEKKDIHILIAGFGKLGQEVLKQAVLLGVNSPDNRIIIDIMDKRAKYVDDIFMKRFSKNSVKSVYDSENDIVSYYILNDPSDDAFHFADGELVIRFINTELCGKEFIQRVDKLHSDIAYTYTTICVENSDVAIECMLSVNQIFKGNLKLPIGVRMVMENKLVEYISKNEKEFGSVFVIGDRDRLLTLEQIYSKNIEDNAMEYSEKYDELYTRFICGENKKNEKNFSKPNKEWKNLVLWKINSNRYASYYYYTFRDKIREKFKIDTLNDSQQIERILDGKGSKLEQAIEKYGITEHRRWCYAMVFGGWSYSEKRDKSLLMNDCLCSWEQMKNNNLNKKMIFDFIPAQIEWDK